MYSSLYQKSLFQLADLSVENLLFVLDLAKQLKQLKRQTKEPRLLAGKNIALVFAKPSTRTRCAFEVAAFDQGAALTYIDGHSSHLTVKESIEDTFAVLGRFYDAIAYRGYSHDDFTSIAAEVDVPVWNALSDLYHPTQALADLLTIRECSDKPWSDIHCCYLGNAVNNVTHSLVIGAAMLGMKMTIAAPKAFQLQQEIQVIAQDLMRKSGGQLIITDDPDSAVKQADFIYTDVWLSMGEPEQAWQERINAFIPYRVDRRLMEKTGYTYTRFMHCLPALHDRKCQLGEKIYTVYGQDGLEVTDEVFTSPMSIVFDQAENRLHTIKAVMLASLVKDLTVVF